MRQRPGLPLSFTRRHSLAIADAACARFQCHGFTVDGCFAQYVVAWASHVSPIPDGMSLFEAAPILCAGVVRFSFFDAASALRGGC